MMTRISKFGSIILLFSISVFAQEFWVRIADNPVLSSGSGWESSHVMSPEVKYIDGEYKMWYNGLYGSYISEIGLATSSDGRNWTKSDNNPVIPKGNNGEWDDYSVSNVTVLYDDSVYYAWYTGDDYVNLAIGYAYSYDGENWIKSANNPVMTPSGNSNWNPQYIWPGSVIKKDSLYHMWYTGQETGRILRVGHATSTDGTTWIQDSLNPVLDLGAKKGIEGKWVAWPEVKKTETGFEMWYAAFDSLNNRICYATSTNGSSWVRSNKNPVLNTGTGWDYKHVTTPAVYYHTSDSIMLWYAGWEQGYRIGLATSWDDQENDRRIHYRAFEYDGINRTYITQLPNTVALGQPVVIALHGGGATGSWMHWYTSLNTVFDTTDYVLVYPDAVENMWNSGIDDVPGWYAPNVNDVGFISALIDTLYDQFGIDTNRVYICGVSNGGAMATRLAARLGYRIEKIASVVGVLTVSNYDSLQSAPPIAALFINSTGDTLVPWEGQTGAYSIPDMVTLWAQHNGYTGEPDSLNLENIDMSDGFDVTQFYYDGGALNKEVVFYRLNGGEHKWPGSPKAYPTAPHGDINSSEIILQFFDGNIKLTNDGLGPQLPDDFSLNQNYPNPFNPTTTIRYQLPEVADVRITVYNIMGQEVKTLVNQYIDAGYREVVWDATDNNGKKVSGGLYLYHIQAGNFQKTMKMVLLK